MSGGQRGALGVLRGAVMAPAPLSVCWIRFRSPSCIFMLLLTPGARGPGLTIDFFLGVPIFRTESACSSVGPGLTSWTSV